MKQHLAVDDAETAAETESGIRRLPERAEQARQPSQFLAELARSDSRLSRCGTNHGRHRRNGSRQPWEPADRGVCYGFSDLDTRHVCRGEVKRDGTGAQLPALMWMRRCGCWLGFASAARAEPSWLATLSPLLRLRSAGRPNSARRTTAPAPLPARFQQRTPRRPM
jgi:hypothetical protein